MSEYTILAIAQGDRRRQAQMDALLGAQGIARERNLSYSAGMFDGEGNMVATGSLFENTLRCMAVSQAHRGEGLLGAIVEHLMGVQLARGNTHLFLYTRCESAKFFAQLGFHEIARVDGRLVFMENRREGFSRYIAALRRELGHADGAPPAAALVINANPFTLGHEHLLARAAAQNERVVLFVLSQERSLVPFEDRMAMARAAAARYKNVQAVATGSYMISLATFPSYFIRDEDDAVVFHAALDATLFARIAAQLGIVRRYVGQEPFSATTALYNQALSRVLPPLGVELVTVPRLERDHLPISASHVRQLIHDGRIAQIRPLVPRTTYAYLTGEAGQNAVARIMAAGEVIHH